jgi:hypothetical protein
LGREEQTAGLATRARRRARRVLSRRVLAAVTAALLIGFAGGCGDGDEPADSAPLPQRVFVGTVSGSNAFIAIVTGGNLASAFVCDGKNGIWALFEATESDATLDLRSKSGATLAGDVTDDKVNGTLTLDGTPLRFTAEPASGEAGLYLAEAESKTDTKRLRAGWIVLDGGEQRGAAQLGSTISAVPRLDVAAGSVTVPGAGSLSPTRVAPGPSRAGQLGGGQFGG